MIDLELASSLTPDFALGWSCLPDEIKERILSYLVVSEFISKQDYNYG
jgi:hypothetical protein